MSFQVEIDGKEYKIEPFGAEKVKYRVTSNNEKTYNLKLSEDGDWICEGTMHGVQPIPVDEIGNAIKDFFN